MYVVGTLSAAVLFLGAEDDDDVQEWAIRKIPPPKPLTHAMDGGP